jgi:galactose oxidase
VRLPHFVLLLLVSLSASAQTAPDVAGEWSPVKKWPFVAIHAALLPNGRIVAWSRKEGVTKLETWVGDPKSGTFTRVMNPYVQPFCGAQTLLADGRLFVAGGHVKWDGYGAKQTTIFDYRTSKWSKSATMNAGRWYPTTTTLANGDVLITSGKMTGAEQPKGQSPINGLPQVWSHGKLRDLTAAKSSDIDLYPWMMLAPNGRVFMAGPSNTAMWLDTSGSGKWIAAPPSKVAWREYGSAVMYEPGKVIILGGSDPPEKSAETIDLTAEKPEWKAAKPMQYARRQTNATLLPDGTVLVNGGSQGDGFNNWKEPALAAERWDPATGEWTTLASAAVPRTYHSVALLLPDATVLSAGGGLPPWGDPAMKAPPGAPDPDYEAGQFFESAQIFSPPYLFKGPRPKIAAAPKKVKYGQTFNVSTPDAASVGSVTWLRLGTVTHAFDHGQRFLRLGFTATDGKLKVTAPAGGNLAPPGPYMLFILDKKGVPSVAKIVMIGS